MVWSEHLFISIHRLVLLFIPWLGTHGENNWFLEWTLQSKFTSLKIRVSVRLNCNSSLYFLFVSPAKALSVCLSFHGCVLWYALSAVFQNWLKLKLVTFFFVAADMSPSVYNLQGSLNWLSTILYMSNGIYLVRCNGVWSTTSKWMCHL